MNKIIVFIGTYKKEIGGLLRHAATIAGGVLIAKGSLTTDSFTMILGSTSSIVGTGWSFVNKASHKKEVKAVLDIDSPFLSDFDEIDKFELERISSIISLSSPKPINTGLTFFFNKYSHISAK